MITEKDKLICPACYNPGENLFPWKFSGFNQSVFNYTAQFTSCPHCGLIWISNISREKLLKFYTEECLYSAKEHFAVDSPQNIMKYKYYFSIFSQFSLTGTPISDIGCGRGGLLKWIKRNYPHVNCTGVDIDIKSLPQNKETANITFLEGTALNLPFDDSSQYTLTFFHVFEHIINIADVLKEAARVLHDNGHLIIEVPDTENYTKNPLSPFFHICIREHVFHYTPESLIILLQRHGFTTLEVKQTTVPAPEFKYSSLIIVAKKNGKSKEIKPKKNFPALAYFKQAKAELESRIVELKRICQESQTVVFWGISNQLLSILPYLKEYYNKITLCDKNPEIQKNRFFSLPITAPEDCLQAEGLLIISSTLHEDKIKDSALKLGWKNNNIISLL